MYGLMRGSAKKYLAAVAKEYGWEVTEIGQHTLRVRYDPSESIRRPAIAILRCRGQG